MPARSLVTLSSALVLLATVLAAASAAPSAAPRERAQGPAVRTLVDGVATDWDAGRRYVSIGSADVSRGSRMLRRAVRRGVTVTLKLTPATRLTAVDADGGRARITPAELFDELDLAADEVGVEASARVPARTRPVAGEVVLPASRIVVYLPPAVGDDPAADPADPVWDDAEPVVDAPVPDDEVGDEADEE
jgi:hypothetical protein